MHSGLLPSFQDGFEASLCAGQSTTNQASATFQLSAGHSVSLPGQTSLSQIPRPEYSQVYPNGPTLADGCVSTSTNVPPAYSNAAINHCFSPPMTVSGDVRYVSVAPYAGSRVEGDSSQHDLHLMQRAESPLSTSSNVGPVRRSAEFLKAKKTVLSSCGDVWLVHRLQQNVGTPCDRHPSPSPSMPGGRENPVPVQGSFVRETPIFQEEQADVDSVVFSTQTQGGQLPPVPQTDHGKNEEGAGIGSVQNTNAVIVQDRTGGCCLSLQEKAFMRRQFDSLRFFLIRCAADSACPFVYGDPDPQGPREVYVEVDAYSKGDFSELGPHLYNALVVAADDSGYPFVQWQDSSNRKVVIARITDMKLQYPARFA